MYEAQGYLRESWIAVNESEFSLLDQKPRMELLPACRKTGVLLVAYRPLGHGILARPGNPFLDGVAERYGKTRSQVALNWVVDQEGVAAVPKSGNPVHLMELAGATGWSLEAADREALAGSFS
jgi:diketogulonate reductase-like aldo/keto reductase